MAGGMAVQDGQHLRISIIGGKFRKPHQVEEDDDAAPDEQGFEVCTQFAKEDIHVASPYTAEGMFRRLYRK